MAMHVHGDCGSVKVAAENPTLKAIAAGGVIVAEKPLI